jgi:hypothetical protein
MLGRKSKPRPNASERHRFVEPEDSRVALSMTAVNPDYAQVASITVATATLREYPCALPGCSRPKDDPIHE